MAGPDSDGLPYAWLRERLESIESRMISHNASLRSDMNTGFRDLSAKFDAHEREDRIVATKVTVIETERGIEKATASRHGAISGSIAAGLVLTAFEAIKKAMGH